MDKNEVNRETAKESYRRKLKDPRWQKIRLKVFERDKFRCQYCRDTENTLQVHHLQYQPNCAPWDYPLHSLITVCESCHEDETMFRRDAEDRLITTLREIGFSWSDLDQFSTALGMAHFPCTKGEFVAFFDWFLTTSTTFEEALHDCFKGPFSSELEELETTKDPEKLV